MTTRPRRRHRGFTLLELILALAMVAMLSLTLYMSMNVGMKARDRVERTVGQSRASLVAADLLRQDLEAVPAPTGVLAGRFYGASSGAQGAQQAELDFFSIGADAGRPDDPLAEGLRHVYLAVRTDVNPPVLVRYVWRNLLTQVQEQPEEEIVWRNVKSFGARFWDGTAWQETWDSTTLGNVLPFAIELTLETSTPSARPGEEPTPYRVTRYITLPCAQYADDATAGATPGTGTGTGTETGTGTGSGTGGTTGGTP
jgi:type II secretion system protein J